MARRPHTESMTDPEHRNTLIYSDDTNKSAEWPTRAESDSAEPTPLNHKQTSSSSDAADPIVSRYFTDVQRYNLLSQAEERKLWRRIDQANYRARRALYTSPVALTTVLHLWREVEQEHAPITQFATVENDAAQEADVQRANIASKLDHLQELETQLQSIREQSRRRNGSAPRRKILRQQRVQLWRDWIEGWEALNLHPDVLQAIQRKVAQALQDTPQDVALRTARSAWLQAQQQETAGKADMMQANLRLVIHVANRYRGRGVAFPDLIQEGNLGLMRALDKFEARRGLKFITYAYWWVRQAVGRAIINQNRTIRVPNHVMERKQRLHATEEKLWTQLGRPPTVDELAVALDWSGAEVQELILSTQPILQLQQSGADDSSPLEEAVADHQLVKPEQLLATSQLQHRVMSCLETLSDREARILRLRYGFETDRPHTLQEIGAMFDLSRERIRQIEQAALEKLRQPQLASMLVDFAPA